jgi:putative ABC transport system ATP-binding protein
MVAAISAGNSNDWAMENSPYGMLYADSVIYNTVGSPGSYINSLSVAAAQNVGATGAPLVFGGEEVFYTETTESGPKMADLDTSADGSGKEFDFVYIDSIGFAEQYKDVNAVLPLGGKVTLVNRGSISFVEKGNNPKPYNPAAILIVNNTNGSISMSTDGYTGNYPYISINGDKLEEMGEKGLTRYRRKHLGYVFQMYNLIPNLNVKENIEVGAYLSDNPLDVDELLGILGLEEHKYKYPNQLSGGQQQRVSIGRAVVKNPDILMCDEPTGALDYNTSKEILGLIEDCNRKYGNTVVMVTHNEAIRLMADHVIKLRDGMVRYNDISNKKIHAADLEW